MVGGSTVFGDGVRNHATIPTHLQNFYLNTQFDGIKEIEIINAGIAGATSKHESLLIKNKLSKMSPDMVIVYDGWNDWDAKFPIEKTIQNWEAFCKLGENKGFDTAVVVQPLTITGNRVLTQQETVNSFLVLTYLQKSQQYVDAFEELDNVLSLIHI